MLSDLLCDLGCLGSHRLSWAQASLSGAQPFSQWLQRLVKLKSQNLQFLQLPLPWRQKGAVQLQHGHREMMDRWRTEADFWWLHWVMFLMTLKFISVYWLSFLFKKHKLKYSFLTQRPSVYWRITWYQLCQVSRPISLPVYGVGPQSSLCLLGQLWLQFSPLQHGSSPQLAVGHLTASGVAVDGESYKW